MRSHTCDFSISQNTGTESLPNTGILRPGAPGWPGLLPIDQLLSVGLPVRMAELMLILATSVRGLI